MEPITLKFQSGIDNRSREYALELSAARVVDNMDVTRDGGLLCRQGARRIHSGRFHSFFVHPMEHYALVVQEGVLCRLNADHTLIALAPVAGPVVYAVLNDQVHWTDGSSVGLVNLSGESGRWGMPVPPAPIAVAVENGGLFSGAYLVAMTAIDENGLESPASELVSLNVADGGGIEVRVPITVNHSFVLYRTPQNGPASSLRRAAVATPGSTVLLGETPLGKLLESIHATTPLPGQCLVQHKGRLWCASGNVVWFTSTLSPHWLFPGQGFYQFESPVRMLGATEDGIYVGLRDRILYLQGSDPYTMTQRSVSGVGAAAGSALEFPHDLFLGEGAFPSRQCAFLDRDGYLCIGKPGGILVRPTRQRYSAGSSTTGLCAYRVYEGLRQILMLHTQAPLQPHWATNQAIREIFNNGVVLNAG